MKYTHTVFRDALWTCLWDSVRVSIYLELSLNWIIPAQGESQQTSNVLVNSFSRNLDQSALPAYNCSHYQQLYNITMTLFASLFVPLLILHTINSSPLPQSCLHQTAGPAVEECAYDTTKDHCGNEVCLRGPGEMCGGKYGRWVISIIKSLLLVKLCNFRYGACADGLMCSNCNRCQGCSFRTFICWEDKNCIYWQMILEEPGEHYINYYSELIKLVYLIYFSSYS